MKNFVNAAKHRNKKTLVFAIQTAMASFWEGFTLDVSIHAEVI